MTSPEPEHVAWRGRGRRLRTSQAVVIWSITPIACLVILALSFGARDRHGSPIVPLEVGGSLAVAGGIALAVLLGRSRVFICDPGVVIRNPLSVHRILWDDIESFELKPSGVYPMIGVVATLTRGEIRMHGIQGKNPIVWGRDRSASRLIGELNNALDDGRRVRRDSPPGTPSV